MPRARQEVTAIIDRLNSLRAEIAQLGESATEVSTLCLLCSQFAENLNAIRMRARHLPRHRL